MINYKQNALIFKAFCDASRLRIIDLICSTDEICACVLLEDLSIGQSTLSHHMKILVDSGIVLSRRDGKRMMYRISNESIESAKKILDDMINGGSIDAETLCTPEDC